MKLGIEKTAMIRVRAGISFALAEAMDEGHCGLPTDELLPLAAELLEVAAGAGATRRSIWSWPRARSSPTRSARRPCVFLAGLYRAERGIAERLRRLVNGTLPWPAIDPDKALPWVEQQHRPDAGREPAGGDPAGAALQGAGHHRRAGRRQDHARQLDPADPGGQGRRACCSAPRPAAPPSG